MWQVTGSDGVRKVSIVSGDQTNKMHFDFAN